MQYLHVQDDTRHFYYSAKYELIDLHYQYISQVPLLFSPFPESLPNLFCPPCFTSFLLLDELHVSKVLGGLSVDPVLTHHLHHPQNAFLVSHCVIRSVVSQIQFSFSFLCCKCTVNGASDAKTVSALIYGILQFFMLFFFSLR